MILSQIERIKKAESDALLKRDQAGKEARAEIEDAGQRAAGIIAAAKRDAGEKAHRMIEDARTSAAREADRIREEGQREAALIITQSAGKIPEAVRYIAEQISGGVDVTPGGDE